MQVLWSRAAQSRTSCRCRSCFHTATNIARRATTVASRRRLKIGDVFTACYSTILATAAVADARVKDERRKEWDRLIEDAKRADPTQQNHKSRGAPETILIAGKDGSEWQDSIQDATAKSKPFWRLPLARNRPTRNLLLPHGVTLDVEDFLLRGSDATRIQARDVDSGYQPGFDDAGNWIEEPFDPDSFNRESQSPTQISAMQDATAKLAESLIQHSPLIGDYAQKMRGRPPNVQQQIGDLAELFKDLDLGKNPMPVFEFDDIDIVEAQRKHFHATLYALTQQITSGKADQDIAVAKICYNLLVTRAPPCTATYNLLLRQFMGWERHDLAQIVADFLLDDKLLRPSKVTIRLLLDHYRNISDKKGFRNVIQRMRGTEGDLKLKRRRTKNMGDYEVQRWATLNKVIHRAGWLHQKAPRSRAIFHSMILGCLEFGEPRSAVRYARAALREGCGVSTDMLCTIINVVSRQSDAPAGLSLLKAIISQFEDTAITTITQCTASLRYALNKLLYLCGIDPNSPTSSQHWLYRTSAKGLSRMLWYIQISSLTDAIERAANYILKLDASIGMSGLDICYTQLYWCQRPHPSSHDTARITYQKRLTWALQVTRNEFQIARRRLERREVHAKERLNLRIEVLRKSITASKVTLSKLDFEVREARTLHESQQVKYRQAVLARQRIEEQTLRRRIQDAKRQAQKQIREETTQARKEITQHETVEEIVEEIVEETQEEVQARLKFERRHQLSEKRKEAKANRRLKGEMEVEQQQFLEPHKSYHMANVRYARFRLTSPTLPVSEVDYLPDSTPSIVPRASASVAAAA